MTSPNAHIPYPPCLQSQGLPPKVVFMPKTPAKPRFKRKSSHKQPEAAEVFYFIDNNKADPLKGSPMCISPEELPNVLESNEKSNYNSNKKQKVRDSDIEKISDNRKVVMLDIDGVTDRWLISAKLYDYLNNRNPVLNGTGTRWNECKVLIKEPKPEKDGCIMDHDGLFFKECIDGFDKVLTMHSRVLLRIECLEELQPVFKAFLMLLRKRMISSHQPILNPTTMLKHTKDVTYLQELHSLHEWVFWAFRPYTNVSSKLPIVVVSEGENKTDYPIRNLMSSYNIKLLYAFWKVFIEFPEERQNTLFIGNVVKTQSKSVVYELRPIWYLVLHRANYGTGLPDISKSPQMVDKDCYQSILVHKPTVVPPHNNFGVWNLMQTKKVSAPFFLGMMEWFGLGLESKIEGMYQTIRKISPETALLLTNGLKTEIVQSVKNYLRTQSQG